jgi:glycosyltransferase involved in cell wall biosynthesis
MRILFVAMSNSIHTARWISQIQDQGWDVYLFPVQWCDPHPLFRHITVFGGKPWRASYLDKSVKYKWWTGLYSFRDGIEGRIKHQILTKNKEIALAKVIKAVKPDIIHSLEFQHAGYMLLQARRQFGDKFPTWIATNWGSDIYLFGKFAEHQKPIREILETCDYYSCECQRDISIARTMGLNASILPVLPNAGGIDLENAIRFRQEGPVSRRKHIIVKGYQGWAGRAFVALQALKLCQEILKDYTITLYVSGEETEIAARLFSYETGIPVEIIPYSSHEEILRQFGKARIYIGLSISDGISTSLLEAMVMGAFPIQSCTACADEWIEQGAGGFMVPPEDPHEIAQAIRSALLDDALVDKAAEKNLEVARQRLDYSKIKTQAIGIYQNIFKSIKSNRTDKI